MPSHLQIATIQAAVLNVISSVLAQLLHLYRTSTVLAPPTALNPLGLNYVAIIQYLITCLVLTPPNFLWQEWLEKAYPGYPVQKGKQKMKVDEDGKVQIQPAEPAETCR
jgi:protein Mpv17